MDIKELLQRIHALIEEYLEIDVVSIAHLQEENSRLKVENYKLKDDLQEVKDIADEYLDACNDAKETLESVIEGRI